MDGGCHMPQVGGTFPESLAGAGRPALPTGGPGLGLTLRGTILGSLQSLFPHPENGDNSIYATGLFKK